MVDLVLASSSTYRAQLLDRLRIPFGTDPADIDETRLAQESPADLVRRLAQAKASAVALRHPTALIIGSDQVASCQDLILGKPGSEANARAQLRKLAGLRVDFVTGLCLLNAQTRRLQQRVVITPVHFRDLSDAEIRAYVAAEQPLDCAGAFKSEGLGVALFEAVEGDDPSALIGLPLIALCDMLRTEGCNPLLLADSGGLTDAQALPDG